LLDDVITTSHCTSPNCDCGYMLSAVRDDRSRPVLGVHSIEAVVCNFYRQWSNVYFFQILVKKFLYQSSGRKSCKFSQIF